MLAVFPEGDFSGTIGTVFTRVYWVFRGVINTVGIL
jgi:hypothetical protein